MPTHRTVLRRVSRGARRLIAVLPLLIASVSTLAGVIPAPAELTPGDGAFPLTARTVVLVPRGDRDADAAARYLLDLLRRSRGLTLDVREAEPLGTPPAGAIVFERRPGLAPEAYALVVDGARITVAATAAAGLFYGAGTLWQLTPVRGPVPAVRVRDQPVYRWRGLMLDSARHYQRPEFIKRLLDAMALHKLNVLHWHLTDDQGWRLEIKRYPKLTSVGAYRVPAGRAAHADIDPSTKRARLYGGFYTQATVRDLVAYAAARQITIIPEIEMPGHASAALAAYPELGVAPSHLAAVPADWGIYSHVYDVGAFTMAAR